MGVSPWTELLFLESLWPFFFLSYHLRGIWTLGFGLCNSKVMVCWDNLFILPFFHPFARTETVFTKRGKKYICKNHTSSPCAKIMCLAARMPFWGQMAFFFSSFKTSNIYFNFPRNWCWILYPGQVLPPKMNPGPRNPWPWTCSKSWGSLV